tara:strand:+ start:4087 stop:4605 length:519 start_codon:yes stop_codon:yes gene_type:complete
MALSDVKVKPMEVNWNSTELGSTQGGVEIAVEVQSTDIVTDQDGTAAQDAYQTGVGISITMTLIELNTANYNAMIATPTGGSAAGSDATVYGYGTSKNFVSMLSMAQNLRLRPVGNSDNAEDWTFWKAVPVVDSLSFASDSANSMSVTFRCFPDSSKPAAVSLGCFGDIDGV